MTKIEIIDELKKLTVEEQLEFIKAALPIVSEDFQQAKKLYTAQIESLIEVWKVLEALTVSLDRLGTYWNFHGKKAAKEALLEYFEPVLNNRIANARKLLVEFLENCDPNLPEKLEFMSENEEDIGYWNGPKAKTNS